MNPARSIVAITIFFVSCTSQDKDRSIAGKNPITSEKHRIAILPFNDVDSILINDLEKALQKKLPLEFFVLGNTPLPPSAFYKLRQRYIADSLLVFLAKTNGNNFEKIIGVTTKDISTRKGEIENWGILGLGDCPGEACVISSFRAGRKKVLYKDFLRRMTTLALHELGHTYGLEHCPVATCLMKDAEGKMNLDDGSSYCTKMPGSTARQRHVEIAGILSIIYSQLTENKQKNPEQNFSDYQIPLPLPSQKWG